MTKPLTVLALLAWYPANAARYFADAFEQLGHGVFRVGPTYFDHYGLEWPHDELPRLNHEVSRESPTWNLNGALDVAAKQGIIPDLIFLSEETYQTRIVPTDKVPVVLWSADGWANSFARKDMIKPTLAYTQHPFGVNPSPQERIPEGWRFLPGGYNPRVHRYTNSGEREFDFTLYCTMYGKRQQICDELANSGFRVSCGQRTMVGFVNGYNDGLCSYHNCNGQAEIKWKFWENAAMGCVNIADENRLFPVLGFKPYEDYVPIEDFDPEFDEGKWPSAASIGRAILAAREYPSIAHTAHTHIVTRHSYPQRVLRILNDLGLEKEIFADNWDEKFRLHFFHDV